ISDEFAARYGESIGEHIDAINERIAEFYEQAGEAWADIVNDLNDRAPDPGEVEWPAPYDAAESDDQLFQSERGYIEQMDFYKAHQGRPTERRNQRKRSGGA